MLHAPSERGASVRTRRFGAALVLFVALSTGAACRKAKNDAPTPGAKTGAPVHLEGVVLLKPTLQESRDAMAMSYRLGPDRRVLSAVAYLDHRMSDRPAERVEARFGEGQWHIRYRGEEVGVMPELPDFEDGEKLLAGVVE